MGYSPAEKRDPRELVDFSRITLPKLQLCTMGLEKPEPT